MIPGENNEVDSNVDDNSRGAFDTESSKEIPEIPETTEIPEIPEIPETTETSEVLTEKYKITGLVDVFDEQGNITGQLPVDSEQELPVEYGDRCVEQGQAERIEE